MRVLLLFAIVVGCNSTKPGVVGGDDQPTPDAPVSRPDAPIPPPPDAPAYRTLCDAPPPEGAAMPTRPALPAAGCPALVPGSNTITSGGKTRSFLLVEPASFAPTEKLPVLFLWHWIGGDANDFLVRGQIQDAAEQQRFLAIIPVSEGATVFGTSLNTKWPFDITQLPTRMDEEFLFFDDMLACAEQQLHINESCVSTIGVSAGALFTDQLIQARANMLASFVSLSGGVNDVIIKPWTGTGTHKPPGVVLWGGDGPPNMDGNKDILGCLGIGMDFSVASRDMETGLVADGHFIVECRHNCGHVEPPLDPPAGESKFASMWEFAMNHPFWLAPGQSPFTQTGLPLSMPPWCSIGAGNSVPRSGDGCPAAENPCQY